MYIRYEDVVVVTAKGCENFTDFLPSKLEEIALNFLFPTRIRRRMIEFAAPLRPYCYHAKSETRAPSPRCPPRSSAALASHRLNCLPLH